MPMELVRGVRDFGPREAVKMRYITSKIEEMFRRFGFYPIETPSIESMDVLNAKVYGEEAGKEMYSVEGGKAGLIYDLTVPLARYVSMNRDLVMPFKRYQIAKVWRRDEPQKMRSREFMQADIDIVGSKEPVSDAEVVAATALALESMGLMNYKILINSRIVLNAALRLFHVTDELNPKAIIVIDKLGKISTSEALSQLVSVGVPGKDAEALLNFVGEKMENKEKFQKILTNAPETKEEVERLTAILDTLDAYGIQGEVMFDLSLARGLNYYTGAVWEFVAFDNDGKRLPSIASGGRYDDLIGLYSKPGYPAVGISIGISRLFEVLDLRGLGPGYTAAYVANINKDALQYAISVANTLRASGINTDLNATSRSISKQLEYANAMGIKYVVIVGKSELDAKKVKLRDMGSGSEELLDIVDAINKIKGS